MPRTLAVLPFQPLVTHGGDAALEFGTRRGCGGSGRVSPGVSCGRADKSAPGGAAAEGASASGGGLSPAARGAGHGVWWRLSGRTFAAVTEAFLFDPTGTLTGRQRLAQEIELAGDGGSLQTLVLARVTNPAGQVVFTGCATSTGRRLD